MECSVKSLDDKSAKRQEVLEYYCNHISSPLIELPERLLYENNVYHLFPVLVKEGKRDALHDYLAEKGIGTVIHYPIAPHKQECYANEAWNVPQLSLPITEELADSELSLPISPCMVMEQVEYVAELINAFK